MLDTTIDVIKAGLRSDPSISPTERAKIMALIRNHGTDPAKEVAHSITTPQLIRRGEVAKRLSCSLRTVDNLPLQKVKLPGRTRAAGFLESDVNALIEQK